MLTQIDFPAPWTDVVLTVLASRCVSDDAELLLSLNLTWNPTRGPIETNYNPCQSGAIYNLEGQGGLVTRLIMG